MENLTPKEKYDLKKEAKLKNTQTRKTKKTGRWFLLLLGVAVLIFGFVALGGNSSEPDESGKTSSTTITITDSDWVKGNPEALVTLIEYSDFQCPACKTYFPILKEVNERLGDKVLFVYRHFPLVSAHPNAIPAARAAEAAGRQGKFWDMHDELFINQDSWSGVFRPTKTFIDYAEKIGLDIEQFEADLDSSEVKDKVNSDLAQALLLGLNSTPSFLLNGKRIANPRSVTEFQELIEGALTGNQ